MRAEPDSKLPQQYRWQIDCSWQSGPESRRVGQAALRKWHAELPRIDNLTVVENSLRSPTFSNIQNFFPEAHAL